MNADRALGPGRLGLLTRVLVPGLAWDVGLPLAAYYVLHVPGASDWAALLAATGGDPLRAINYEAKALNERNLEAFASLVVSYACFVWAAPAMSATDDKDLLRRPSRPAQAARSPC